MSLGPYRPISSGKPVDRSVDATPPVPAALVGAVLLLAVALAIAFIVAAQVVQTL